MGTRNTALLLVLALLFGCNGEAPKPDSASVAAPDEVEAPTQPDPVEAAEQFVAGAESELERLARAAERAGWMEMATGAHDPSELAGDVGALQSKRRAALARQAAQLDTSGLPPELARKIAFLRQTEGLPSPLDSARAAELSEIKSGILANYRAAANCTDRPTCRKKEALYKVLRTSRDPQELAEAWLAWRQPGREILDDYGQMVELANQGARDAGYANVAELWRSAYEMKPEAFAADLDRQWKQLQPLYDSLHCHVRARLGEVYGTDVVPPEGLIPAHLLGNMWAQFWTHITEFVGPGSEAEPIDTRKLLEEKGIDPTAAARLGEAFYLSLGFEPLPDLFWEHSIFERPEGSEMSCQGYASPIDPPSGDVRMKLCAKLAEDPLGTIHHELGHVYYYLAYKEQPYPFREGANPGFHEAIGEAIQRSVTPAYLRKIGLLDDEAVDGDGDDLAYLFQIALRELPWIATALIVEQWRSQVFRGEVSPAQYNERWWELRRRYQGVSPPVPRGEGDFDPGMFFHVSYNVPFARYFVATILQFDFHRALCAAAGHQGPARTCSIYGSKEAGEKLWGTLALGASRPWPDALEQLTGSRTVDATAMLEYFEPVQQWLEEQNRGRSCGWKKEP